MKERETMKNAKKIRLLLPACMIFGIMILPGQMKRVPPVSQPKPPIVIKCIDIIIPTFTATLVSTQVGRPGIEFPTDTVTLRAVLKNAGLLPLPADAQIELRLYRNNEPIKILNFTNILGAGGSTWTWTCTDTFPHGLKTLYMVWAGQIMYQECSVDNNAASFYVNETLLHAVK
jgi:hypothetical protein